MECPHCDTAIVNDAKFCHNCGNAIDQSQELIIDRKNGLYGYIDKNRNIIIEHKYKFAQDFIDGVALVARESVIVNDLYDSIYNKYALIDLNGDILKELDYGIVGLHTNEKNDLSKEDYWIVNKGGALFDRCGSPWEWYGGRFGYIDKRGDILIPLIYKDAKPFYNGLAAVLTELDVWIFIDKQGQRLSKRVYDRVADFKEGMAAVCNYDKWGYIDISGMEVIPINYSNAQDFSESLAGVQLKSKWGYIDKLGRTVIPFEYDKITAFKSDIARVRQNHKWHCINRKGERISKTYNRIDIFSNGIAIVYNGKAYGYINMNGEEVIPCIYEKIFEYEDRLWVKQNGKWGVINYENDIIIPFEYDYPFRFINNYAWVNKNDKWGYVNSKGEIICPFQYDFVYDDVLAYMLMPNSERDEHTYRMYPAHLGLDEYYSHPKFMWQVQKNDKWGLIDFSGKEIAQCIYDFVDLNIFWDVYRERHIDIADKLTFIRVRKNNKYGFLGLDGREMIPCVYNSIVRLSLPDFLMVEGDGGCGIIDWDNNMHIPCEYNFVYHDHNYDEKRSLDIYYSEGYFWIEKDGKLGTLNLKGEQIIPYIYDTVYCFKDGIAEVERDGYWFFVDYYGNELEWINFYRGHHPFIGTSESIIKQLLSLKKNNENIYLFFDTETTGVPKDYKASISDLDNWPRLVQLAWILCDEKGDEIISSSNIIKPFDTVKDGKLGERKEFSIPIEASNIHGITTKIAMKRGYNRDGVLMSFVDAAELADTIICHNTEFDTKIVGAELLRVGSDFKIDSKPSICTMLSSKNYCAIPNPYQRKYGDPYKWPKLQELHKKLFGVEFEDAHDAMADIQATKKCFFELLKRNIISI